MAEPERYLTIAELDDELPYSPEAFDLDDEAENADGMTDWELFLERLLDQESDRIERYAETVFEETQATGTLYGGDAEDDGTDLVLPKPKRPVASVESIDADGDIPDIATDVRVHDTHVELLADASIDRWPDGPIEITWTYGYSDVPGPVRDGLVRLVRSRLERIQSDGLESESLPSGQSASFRPPEDVQAAVAASVRKYEPDSYYGGTMVI